MRRRGVMALAIAFVVLDVSALALLGPVTPSDTAQDVARLYGDHGTRVLVSRLVHSIGLSVALVWFAVVRGRLHERETGTGSWSTLAFAGLVAVVPVELVRNVIMAVLALRVDEIGPSALGLHLVAVVLGPAIGFPLAASLVALAVVQRSPATAAVACASLLAGSRVVTTSDVVWFGGVGAFVALLAVLLHLSWTIDRPVRERAMT